MDTYGHQFENRLGEVADALDRARQQAAINDGLWTTSAEAVEILFLRVAPVLPEGRVINLNRYRSDRVSAGQPRSEESAPGRNRTYAPASGARKNGPGQSPNFDVSAGQSHNS